jgi:hypothetical protein
MTEDPVLARLSEICLSLPEASCEDRGQHAQFLVRGRTFAYYLVDHHGDGIVALCFRAAPGENEVLVASDPTRFYLPAYIGPRGWGALRLDLDEIDWTEVSELVTDSYRLGAPKRLSVLVDAPPV